MSGKLYISKFGPLEKNIYEKSLYLKKLGFCAGSRSNFFLLLPWQSFHRKHRLTALFCFTLGLRIIYDWINEWSVSGCDYCLYKEGMQFSITR